MNSLFQRTKKIAQKYPFLYCLLKEIKSNGFLLVNKIFHYWLEKRVFYKSLGYRLNLQNPVSFNEKIIWKKIYDRNPLLPVTADKVKVRSYIKVILKEKQAKEILIPLLYVTDKPEIIPFKKLPPEFIVKANHGSGYNIIVKNSHYNKEEIIKTCRRWLRTPYDREGVEWAYQSIRRKILIEKLLHEDNLNSPIRYNFHMFHGKCKLIRVVIDGNKKLTVSTYDEKWNFLSVKKQNRPQGNIIPKPKNYDKMLEIAEKLSNYFDYVRVDLYNLQGKIYFGELTH